MVKVRIYIEDTSFWGVNSELLWASEAVDGFVLENSPTYAYGYSYKDTVSVVSQDGELVVVGVVARGGHSTYRIVLREDFDPVRWDEYWLPLEQKACSYESNEPKTIFSVDVNPKANIHEVYKLLERGENEQFWDFEEGHCGHPL